MIAEKDKGIKTDPHIPHPLVLIVLDGWGYREEQDANAIAAAKKPNWDYLWKTYPHTLLEGCGHAVGLPCGQMGNSEVGHLTMGAGRIIYQDLTRIDLAIENGEFFTNPAFLQALTRAQKNHKNIHILGLLSPGGVHSHEQHLHSLLKLCAQQGLAKNVYVHAFLDGRDTPPRSALASLKLLLDKMQDLKCGEIRSIIGRYYAMDRDKRWDRVQKAYDLLTLGESDYQAKDALSALHMAYERGENDEFVAPTSIQTQDQPPAVIQEGDIVIFMNFRADRARELTQALVDPGFTGFPRGKWPKLGTMVTLTEYEQRLATTIAFSPQSHTHILAECISSHGLQQLRIAETEKYAHVTFFFNGGVETPFPGEERILVPSPKIATYDLKPEMSAYELTERLVQAIQQQKFDVIICNFANADMVGHSGNFVATVKAIEALDDCLGKIFRALQAVGGEMLITADHGNAEMMFDKETHQAHTAHTHSLVPFIFMGREANLAKEKETSTLSDIAPTILYLLNLPQPLEMTGKSLINLEKNNGQ